MKSTSGTDVKGFSALQGDGGKARFICVVVIRSRALKFTSVSIPRERARARRTENNNSKISML